MQAEPQGQGRRHISGVPTAKWLQVAKVVATDSAVLSVGSFAGSRVTTISRSIRQRKRRALFRLTTCDCRWGIAQEKNPRTEKHCPWLPAYDGYVLQTALAEGLALLTLDLGLARAAQKIGVKLQEF
jgi:hypothetical protein